MQAAHRLVCHDKNNVSKLLRARLQPEGAGSRIVIANILAVHAQHTISAMRPKNEASFQHVWKYQNAFSLRTQLRNSRTLTVEPI